MFISLCVFICLYVYLFLQTLDYKALILLSVCWLMSFDASLALCCFPVLLRICWYK